MVSSDEHIPEPEEIKETTEKKSKGAGDKEKQEKKDKINIKN